MYVKRGFSRKGQITLFVILGLILVGGVLLFFLFLRKPSIVQPEFSDPKQFIDSCAKESTEEAISLMLPQGGYLDPKNFKLDEDQHIAYLCYTSSYYVPCTNQEPLYLKHLEDEITNYIKPKIEGCFSQLKQDLEKRNYQVEEKDLNAGVSLETQRVKIQLKKYLKLTKNNQVQEFTDFSSSISSPLYDLGFVAQGIASQEAKVCDFEYVGYMILHKEFDISKKAVGQAESASKIYSITDRNSGKKLNIAIRSCAIPPGF